MSQTVVVSKGVIGNPKSTGIKHVQSASYKIGNIESASWETQNLKSESDK